jgi:hypothetical protein
MARKLTEPTDLHSLKEVRQHYKSDEHQQFLREQYARSACRLDELNDRLSPVNYNYLWPEFVSIEKSMASIKKQVDKWGKTK